MVTIEAGKIIFIVTILWTYAQMWGHHQESFGLSLDRIFASQLVISCMRKFSPSLVIAWSPSPVCRTYDNSTSLDARMDTKFSYSLALRKKAFSHDKMSWAFCKRLTSQAFYRLVSFVQSRVLFLIFALPTSFLIFSFLFMLTFKFLSIFKIIHHL